MLCLVFGCCVFGVWCLFLWATCCVLGAGCLVLRVWGWMLDGRRWVWCVGFFGCCVFGSGFWVLGVGVVCWVCWVFGWSVLHVRGWV